MKRFSMFFAVFLSLSLVFAFAGDNLFKRQYRETLMERSPGQFDPAEYLRTQQETFDWLTAEAAPLSPRSMITVNVTAEELAGIESYECETCGVARKMRVGLVKPLGAPVSFNPSGLSTRTPDGGFVWTAAIESPKATALRVHFTNFSLPSNAALYIYNLEGEAFGPYIGSGPGFTGDFWTNTVTGSVAYVQLRYFGSPADIDLKSISFNIEGIGFLSEKFRMPFLQHLNRTPEELSSPLQHCPENEDCVEDASCFSGGAISDAKKAAAAMQWISGAWIYMCSGGLIADTDTGSQIPYFLTANHCISKGRDAANLECFFQYWTASCHSACYDPVGVCPRTLGADIKHSSRDGDHTLMQLRENPPAGSVFMGWTSQPVAFADGTHLFRISHPSGMPQAYSEHVVDSDYVECGTLPVGQFIYSQDVVGATEGGSSGSPVMNMSGQIVGQLYGACGYTLEVCDFEQNRTVDGAFAFYFDLVKQWLDPAGGGPVGEKMHVSAIDLSIKQKGPNTDAIAKVTIVNETGAPVSGAVVTGTFSGDVTGTQTGTTDANGLTTLKITKSGAITTFTFCVDNVTHSSLTYDPAANVETCDTY